MAREAFCTLARHITLVETKERVYQIFAVQDGSGTLSSVLPYIFLSEECVSVVQTECNNWKQAAAWVGWWSRLKHLKMLCKPFKDMEDADWDRAPKDTNGVERMNRLSKTRGSIHSLYMAMESLYQKDKALLLQYIASIYCCSWQLLHII